MKDFDIFDLLAILGTLAWIPPIFMIINNKFIKPKISIMTEIELEIGYSTFGPIINTRLAFISDNKKALIKKIEAELTHENNDTQKFTWDWFEEILYETDIPNTGSMPTKKSQKAIAINLKKEELIEKKIGFQQNSFKKKQKEIIQKTIEDISIIEKSGKEINEITSKKSYYDLVDHYKHSFNWKTGKYSLVFKVYESSIKNPIEKKIHFSITPLDINNLELNISYCKNAIDRFLFKPSEELINWKWINPMIKE